MDSVNRIFALITEAKKKGKGKAKAMIPTHHEKKGGKKSPLGKANRFDHDAVSESTKKEKKEVLGTKDKKIYVYDPKKGSLIPDKRRAPRKPEKQKVDASTEIVTVLGLIKEAYTDNLISEEAFLSIAGPIMQTLSEKKRPQVSMDQGRERKVITKAKDKNLSKKKKLPKLTDKDKEPPSKDETPW